MPDVLTRVQRSFCMSRIRGKDTSPEVSLRKALWGLGIRYRLKNRLIGRPDFVVPRARVAVFIDGCFWHGCPDHFTMPVTRRAFWKKKIENNRARDAIVGETLRAEGWQVVRIWEHEVEKDPVLACKAVLKAIRRHAIPRT